MPDHRRGELDRRSLLMFIGAAVLAACADSTTGSGGATTTTGRAVSSASTTAQPETLTLGGAPVAAAHRFDAHALQTAASYAGTWLGAWIDDAGHQGTIDVVGAVDRAARLATVTISVAGQLFGGAPPPATTYRVRLDSYAADADSWSARSPQFGAVAYDTTSRVISFTDVPGHPDIDSVTIATQLGAATATMAVSVHPRTGAVSRTAIALARGTRAAVPSLSAATGSVDFVQGVYAASLVTTAELAAAFGRAATAPVANGGNPVFGPGLQTSNGTAKSADGKLIAQWTVYRATDAARARAQLELNAPISTVVGGLGQAALQWNGAVVHLEVLVGREVVEIGVDDTSGATSVDARTAIQRKLAQAMVARMGGG